MKCPVCENKVRLTWPMYLRSPLGRHSCPGCQAKFHLRNSARYYLTAVGLVATMALVLAFIVIRLHTSAVVTALIGLACVLVAVPLDKHIDDTWRGTVADGSPPPGDVAP